MPCAKGGKAGLHDDLPDGVIQNLFCMTICLTRHTKSVLYDDLPDGVIQNRFCMTIYLMGQAILLHRSFRVCTIFCMTFILTRNRQAKQANLLPDDLPDVLKVGYTFNLPDESCK